MKLQNHGYYWVRIFEGGNWHIGEYSIALDGFWLCGRKEICLVSEMAEIDNKLICR